MGGGGLRKVVAHGGSTVLREILLTKQVWRIFYY